jgi:hypothetical protein
MQASVAHLLVPGLQGDLQAHLQGDLLLFIIKGLCEKMCKRE